MTGKAVAAAKPVKGDFVFVIKAASRLEGKVYLITELDHCAQQNKSIVLSPSVVAYFDNETQQPGETFFLNKKVGVSGAAERVETDFHCNSKKTTPY